MNLSDVMTYVWRFAAPGSCSGVVLASTEEEALTRAQAYLDAAEYSSEGLCVYPMDRDETYNDEAPFAVIAGY